MISGVGAELIGQRRRVAVRQAKEHHVVAGEHVELGGFEHPARPAAAGADDARASVRARAGRGGQRTDRQPAVGVGRMPEQQAQNLPAGVAAGTGDRH